jgi:hypothetical protein
MPERAIPAYITSLVRPAQLSILRAIASSDLHNLVYRADYRIVLALTANPAAPLAPGA